MNSNARLIAEIPLSHQAEGICWLILEDDGENTGGWYLYSHKDLEDGAVFDSWHPTRSEAQREATNRWGVAEADWKPDVSQ